MKVRSLPCAAALALVVSAAHADEPKPAPLSLSVTPSSSGEWALQIVNTGPQPQRLHADVRLLSFEIIGAPVAHDEKKPQKARAYPRGKLPVCRAPAELRPLDGDRTRQVVLAPGERWEATFDPVLLCGATKLDGELTAGAVVYPLYGYPAPQTPKWKKPPKEDDPELPFIAEVPGKPDEKVLRRIEGTVSLVPPPVPLPPPATTDQKRDAEAEKVEPLPTQMKLDAPFRGDASRGAEVTVTVSLAYEGKRKTLVHVRADDLDFDVVSPSGERHTCSRRSGIRGPARDLFETWKPHAKRAFTTRLFEVCGPSVFERPGVYTVSPTLVLHEAGAEYSLQALVAKASTAHPVKIRVRTGTKPFLQAPAEVAKADTAAPAKPTP